MKWLLRAETPQARAVWVLALSPWLIGIWRYFLEPAFVQAALEKAWGPEISRGAGGLAAMFGSFVLLGLIPALLVRCVFRETLGDYGWGLGNRFRTVRSFLIALPVAVGGAYVSSLNPDVAKMFPLNPRAGETVAWFALHTAAYLTYYIGWEFFFRGFMQSALTPAHGLVAAVLIQTMASALGHLGRLPDEMFVSILGGLVWGWLAQRTQSVISGMLQHALLGIGLDAFLCLRAAGWHI
jgi:membrane protease YdiL (CAAX protease family)